MSAICRELNIQQPHVSYFLKGSQYDMFITVENANRLVKFIEEI